MNIKTILSVGVSFVAGLAIGAVATKKYMEKKFEEEYVVVENEENQTVEETAENIVSETSDKCENKEVIENDQPVKINNTRISNTSKERDDYENIISSLNYSIDRERDKNKQKNERGVIPMERDLSKPYNISHEEFSDDDAYECDEYTMYADGYVTDSYGMPIGTDDIENLFGLEFRSFFGEYENDQIWIRNDRLQMDFSIVRDLDNFEEVAPARIKRMVGLGD